MVDWKKLSDDKKIQRLVTLGTEIQAAKALLDEFEQLTVSWLDKVYARKNGQTKSAK